MSAEAAPLKTNLPVQKKQPDSPWRIAIRRFSRNRLAVIGLFIIVFMFLLCFVGPVFSPYSLYDYSVADKNLPPSSKFWLGTDKLGRDILLRMMLAGRISLTVGLVATGISIIIGATLGALAGFYRRWVDTLIMRMADIFMALPTLPILIILGAILSDLKVEPADRIYFLMLIIGVLGWSGISRLVRGQILTLREQEFMQATEALGLKDRRKIFRHLLPNTIPIIIVSATLGVAGAIIYESALSFLGVGVVPPTPSWGNMISAANNLIDFRKRPWLWIPPGMCILVTVVAINLIGDGLRDALDPKMKK
ncbi:binding-protein-dependent transport systems inner membrane component [Paenibacillus vortex V453]|uniref:Binding-protein-dependent transport systems inner membrane component n=1 Tax=Paenibacillus vortex V453 TaxID=715225 RepID=A0A2R9T2M6_9BACL|nr:MULTISPECIES: oligopeptide ABC transporter permease [Paenibacillus]ANA80142.1 peptide ABC transporter permease [Paenibacillus glucanolyticus]AVV55832.1 ABC transporter permease [Paenibacillus glucanolyticus]AWP30351.1 peptide ABC transporter permease [Paenibacillus sp. Cedars]EFU43908.1 binding-protein-dependent transport systems inner membrane component [Paenibacillus vortex V453]ETT38551.1 binding-protein-dependent transport systems inner membrane component [Paenibacillus sp. FSL R5-808]